MLKNIEMDGKLLTDHLWMTHSIRSAIENGKRTIKNRKGVWDINFDIAIGILEAEIAVLISVFLESRLL